LISLFYLVLRRAHERWNRFTKSAERGIIQEAFDSTARATIAALKRALPDRSEAEIVLPVARGAIKSHFTRRLGRLPEKLF
jgi:hypothetical protein